ncbi:MAG: 50S ribosomal protein L17 [Candidatus Bipolaricaulia bacterium]
MRHRRTVRKLGREPAHRKRLLANLVRDLILHGQVSTTVTKAKESQRYAERMTTLAKRGDGHARRQAFRFLQDKQVVEVLFTEIGQRYQDRQGGYTRVLKLPPRRGDGAEMARLMWVED